MRKFKELVEQLISLNEYKRGFKSQAAARDVVRSRSFVQPNYNNTTKDPTVVVAKDYTGQNKLAVERPDKPGSGEADTELLKFNRQVSLSSGKERRERVKSELQKQAAQRGQEKAKSTAALTKQIAKSETSAKTFGIPDIHAIVKGKQGSKDVAGVTVVDHEKNGYIALHQGVLHFKHPNGKTHAGIELQPSHQGIAVWAMSKGKRSNKPIAHIHPKGDAIPVSGYVRSGNVQIDAEDELNK